MTRWSYLTPSAVTVRPTGQMSTAGTGQEPEQEPMEHGRKRTEAYRSICKSIGLTLAKAMSWILASVPLGKPTLQGIYCQNMYMAALA
jgi:hypothetical protein